MSPIKWERAIAHFRASPFLSPTGCQAQMNAGEVRTACRLENRRYGRLENPRYERGSPPFPDGLCEYNIVELFASLGPFDAHLDTV